jgi:hypothetical protein
MKITEDHNSSSQSIIKAYGLVALTLTSIGIVTVTNIVVLGLSTSTVDIE